MKKTLNWNALKKALPAFVLTTALAAGFAIVSENPRVLSKPKNNKNDKNRFIQVQLLGINDFHGQLDMPRKLNGRELGGADYLSAYLKERKSENKNTLLVHAGDMVGGSAPISSLLDEEPTIEVLNKMGLQLGTLGNHEFDKGVDEMMRLIHGGTSSNNGYFEGAKFPYICANVIDNKTNKTILPPFMIKQFNGVPIGFIGVVIRDTPKIAPPNQTDGVTFLDEVKAINQSVSQLKKKGVKAIVVLAHNGGSQSGSNGKATGAIVKIAKKINDEVDVIFSAHTHTYLNKEIDGKLVVQAYSYGTAFADVDLKIDPNTSDVSEKKAEIVTVYQDSIKPDPEITNLVQSYEAKIAPVVNKVIGTASLDLSSARNKNGESPLGNLIADSQRIAMNSDFAFMNPSGIRSDLLAGEITWGELYTIQPFKYKLVKMTLTGKQIRQILNQQWQQNSLKRMLQVSGLTYTWDGSRMAGHKILEIFHTNGKPIDPQANYTVTANSYLANGGDNFSVFREGMNKMEGPTDLDALITYIQNNKQPLTASIEGRVQKIQEPIALKNFE